MTQWYKKEPYGAFWERGYRDTNISCMGGPSFEVVEIWPYLPQKAKVLDLGCGEGRNALFLAGKGCDVTAVDRSRAGIDKLAYISKQYNIPLNAVVQDIAAFPIEEEYDLVMAHGVLYYLDNETWRSLLSKVKQQTKIGGFNIFTLFVYTDEYPCGDEIESAHYKGSFRPNELQEFYHDWTQHRYDQYVKWDAHPGIPLHCHPIEKLVAQKPLKKIEKVFFDVGADISEEDFSAIAMGLSQEELIHRIGPPSFVWRMPITGIQLNVCHGNHQATTDNYQFELWHYGKHQFYIINGEVAGRALYQTKPHSLKFCNDS